MALSHLGQHEKSIDLLGRTLSTGRETPGDHRRVVLTMTNLGRTVLAGGDPAEAERLLAEAPALSRRIFREDHPRLADALRHYASVARLRDLAEAERLYREAVEQLNRSEDVAAWRA